MLRVMLSDVPVGFVVFFCATAALAGAKSLLRSPRAPRLTMIQILSACSACSALIVVPVCLPVSRTFAVRLSLVLGRPEGLHYD